MALEDAQRAGEIAARAALMAETSMLRNSRTGGGYGTGPGHSAHPTHPAHPDHRNHHAHHGHQGHHGHHGHQGHHGHHARTAMGNGHDGLGGLQVGGGAHSGTNTDTSSGTAIIAPPLPGKGIRRAIQGAEVRRSQDLRTMGDMTHSKSQPLLLLGRGRRALTSSAEAVAGTSTGTGTGTGSSIGGPVSLFDASNDEAPLGSLVSVSVNGPRGLSRKPSSPSFPSASGGGSWRDSGPNRASKDGVGNSAAASKRSVSPGSGGGDVGGAASSSESRVGITDSSSRKSAAAAASEKSPMKGSGKNRSSDRPQPLVRASTAPSQLEHDNSVRPFFTGSRLEDDGTEANAVEFDEFSIINVKSQQRKSRFGEMGSAVSLSLPSTSFAGSSVTSRWPKQHRLPLIIVKSNQQYEKQQEATSNEEEEEEEEEQVVSSGRMSSAHPDYLASPEVASLPALASLSASS